MGRKRTVHLNLPEGIRPRVRPSGTYYYFDTGTKEIPLGQDYISAIKKWAELVSDGAQAPVLKPAVTFRKVCELYLASPKFRSKAPRTQKDNLGEFVKLWMFFDKPPAPLEAIKPHRVAQYRDWRQSTHSTQEIALLSAVWSWAREQGLTDLPNPTQDVERNRGTGRDVYVSDAMYRKVYDLADQPTRDAMDLARLAGQRPGDNLKMDVQDLQDEPLTAADLEGWHPPQALPWDGRTLFVQQGKTGARLRVKVRGELARVIDRVLARRRAVKALCGALVVNEQGQPLTASALDGRFGKAREAAGIKPQDFQMRDLRAKAGTDVDARSGQRGAQELLGHTGPSMTNRYIRHRKGKLVEPNSGTGER